MVWMLTENRGSSYREPSERNLIEITISLVWMPCVCIHKWINFIIFNIYIYINNACNPRGAMVITCVICCQHHTSALIHELWLSGPDTHNLRFGGFYASSLKITLFSYLILQRFLISRPPLRAFNKKLKPTQFVSSTWECLQGVWDISTPPELSQRAAFH